VKRRFIIAKKIRPVNDSFRPAQGLRFCLLKTLVSSRNLRKPF